MSRKSVRLVKGVFIHTLDFGDTAYQHVKVQSESHAERICGLLGWHERNGGAGGFFRHTWYNPSKKHLVSRCGYDV